MNDILIFGSSGFIGKRIYNFLIEQGFIVKGFSSKTCDLLERLEIRKALSLIKSDFSMVICSSFSRSKTDTLDSMVANIKMIDNIVKEIQCNWLKNIIFMSSVDIYGSVINSKRINENTPILPTGYYGLSKLVCERILNFIKPEIPTTILRLPGIYGYDDQYNSVVAKFIKSGILKQEITITNDGNDLRDYVEISDLCVIVEHFILNPYDGPINVATGQSKTIYEISKIVIEKLDNGSTISKGDATSSSINLSFDNNLIKSLFPHFNFTDISSGIERFIEAI